MRMIAGNELGTNHRAPATAVGILAVLVLAFAGAACGTGEGREAGLERDGQATLTQEGREAGEEHEDQEAEEDARRWDFDDVATGTLPEGWRAEATNPRGPVASWSVRADPGAPSKPNVLALTDTKESSGSTFNLLWTDAVRFRDGEIGVKVRAGTGREDQGGGPIWRVRDRDNYYIARWNPLEDNFRLYYVKDGRRVMRKTATVRADPAAWHTIEIEHGGDGIECYFDGKLVLQTRDETFPEAGGVGVWTKADAASLFDDFELEVARDR